MDSLPDNSLVVSVGGQIKYMSGQIFYKFRQASDFWYLTGFEEPDSAVILEKNSSSKGYRMTLFCAGKDSAKEKWEGARTSFQDAVAHFKADDAQPVSKFPSVLKTLAASFSNVYMDAPPNSRRGRGLSHKAIMKYLSFSNSSSRSEFENFVDSVIPSKRQSLAPEVAKLRSIKSDPEKTIMRKAADISGRAHAKTMRFTNPDMSEHNIASHFEYLCAMQGSQRPAYVPVVASGANALTIHYTANNQIVHNGEMILIDAGCEYNGYASDITRTYPVSGKFSSAQAALYSSVLTVQKKLITMCTEAANISLSELHRESCILMRSELNRIGFNLHGATGMGDVERVLYPHYVGHPIGIDLHESTHFDRNAPIRSGMVITIEPGVYVPAASNFPTAFHDMGIRIEVCPTFLMFSITNAKVVASQDEVLVGKDHPTILSVNAPKEIADVEGACQGLLDLSPF
ncbi:hypothetical protein NLI96_g9335 [Meripilus lineatus]|uniref:Aminopeptidase P N-terminal domain-containing protein n=1 Tax=Meripilus lineatus TaxID=2056292 RepID=A0AAD5YD08_9APHY|nr:hypothetical protein NLI96_g9335 [Physisporinus lineatus]